MGKFYDIDPNTCSIEELKGAIASCNANVELFGALEQGCKKFINSVYGALGSRYYVCANTAIAESVTLQGQDLIKFSSRKVNYLVHELWHKINDVVKPKAFIMDENGNLVKVIVYTTPDEELECLCETGNYIFVSDDSILIGYDSFIDILKDNKNLKMVDCELVNGDKKTTGKKIELNYESLKYVRSYLNIYRRIAHDMVKINPEFDVDAFMVNCLTQVEYPKETQKSSSDTLDENGNPLKINTLQVYGDTDSSYLTLQPLIESCKISPEMATKFILSFNEHVMSGYLNLQFESYAKKFNCPVNLENFELEKVARSVVMQKKKKYVMDIAWDDSNTFYEPLHKVTFSGVEAVKGESSKFIRNEQKEFVRWIIDNINNGKKLRYPEIVSKIKQIKDRFRMANPDDICITKSMSDYEKYILNDKGSTIRYVETLAEQKKQLSDDVDDLFDDEDSQEEEQGQGRTISVPFHVKSAA
ncbi:unnamed protein product, partial [Cylicocyclus nassatus]